MANKLVYKDYRPIKEGDVGWTPEKQKARWYYSPSSETGITYYRFSTAARGGKSYEKYAKERAAKGIPKKKYKARQKPAKKQINHAPRKQKKQPLKLVKKQPLHKRIRKQQESGSSKAAYYERRTRMQDAFANTEGGLHGRYTDFDSLSDSQKDRFWALYEELAQHGPVSRGEWDNEYQNFFEDIDYDEYLDFAVGETP